MKRFFLMGLLMLGMSASASLITLSDAQEAYQRLGAINIPSEKVKERLLSIWNLGDGKRLPALHAWMDELSQEGVQTTDEEVFLLRRAALLWCNHYGEKERALFYRHLYGSVMKPNLRHIPYSREFLNWEASYGTPEKANALLVMRDVICGVQPEVIDRPYRKPDPTFLASDCARVFQNPQRYASYYAARPTEQFSFLCRQANYEMPALLAEHSRKGIMRWNQRWGTDLPQPLITAMSLRLEQLEAEPIVEKYFEEIIAQAEEISPELRGFLPRAVLLVNLYAKPWKALNDQTATLFLMPDSSAVTLRQWDDALFGSQTTLAQDFRDFEKIAKETDSLPALLAFSLKEAESVLPENYWRRNMGVEGYDSFEKITETEYLAAGVDLVITPLGPSFSMNDEALRAQSRDLSVALHRCVLKLAQLEHQGNLPDLKSSCAALADLFNKHQLWPLLINEYELRGVSPRAYVELLRNYQGSEALLEVLALSTGNEMAYRRAQKEARPVAEVLEDMFILQGKIAADEVQDRELAEKLIRAAVAAKDPFWSHFASLYGYADILGIVGDIPKELLSGDASYAGFKLVQYALMSKDVAEAEALLEQMLSHPRALTYPCVRFAQVALAEAKGESLPLVKKEGLLLAAWRMIEEGETSLPASLALIDAGLLDEAFRLDILFSWSQRTELFHRRLAEAFAVKDCYKQAAYVLERVLHQDCLSCTPLGGRSSEAQFVEFKRRARFYHAWAMEEQGAPVKGDASLEDFSSPLYTWHLKTENGSERISARIISASYRAIPSKAFVQLITEKGRAVKVRLTDLAPDDVDNIKNWCQLNEIRVWSVRKETLSHGLTLDGKIVGAGQHHFSRRRIELNIDVTSGEYVMIRSPQNITKLYYVAMFEEESRKAMWEWAAANGTPFVPKLRTFDTWKSARTFADDNKIEARAFLVGKRGGAADQALQEWLASSPEQILAQNAASAILLCYQDDKGKWDVAGQEIMDEITPQLLALYPQATSIKDTPQWRGGISYSYEKNRGRTIHPSLYPEGEKTGETIQMSTEKLDEALLEISRKNQKK